MKICDYHLCSSLALVHSSEINTLIGASLSLPHTNVMYVAAVCMYIYIYMYVSYIRLGPKGKVWAQNFGHRGL